MKNSKYIVIRHCQDMPEQCSGCSFGGKIINCLDSKGEMIADWIDEISKGHDITVYKKIDLDVVVVDE